MNFRRSMNKRLANAKDDFKIPLLLPMKIENIIEDIIHDTIDIRNKLQEQLKKLYPGLVFIIELPALEELSAIKKVALAWDEGHIHYRFSVDIHTHNGNRVFEKASSLEEENLNCSRSPMQDNLINVLRDVIKRKKARMKTGHRSDLLNVSNYTSHKTNTHLISTDRY